MGRELKDSKNINARFLGISAKKPSGTGKRRLDWGDQGVSFGMVFLDRIDDPVLIKFLPIPQAIKGRVLPSNRCY